MPAKNTAKSAVKSTVKSAARRPITAEDLYALQFVEDPQISPDGKHIAFVKLTIDKLNNKYKRNLWLADLTGKTPRIRQFTFSDKGDHTPRWAPDGKTLAFVSMRDEVTQKPQIYLIGLDGGEARPLTSLRNGATNPTWSPGGKRLAFLSNVNAEERRREDAGQEEPPPETLLEAKHRKESREEEEKKKADPRIITRLPYRTGTEFYNDRFSHIYVVDAPEAGDEKPEPYRLTDGEMSFSAINWSNDGKHIYSTQAREPDYEPWFNNDVIRIAAIGKRKPFTRLTRPGHDYYGARVSPDGKWLAAIRTLESGSFGHTAHLALMPASGGAVRDLTLKLDRPVELFQWAADSKSIYFQAADQGDIGLYRVPVSGGQAVKIVEGRRMVLGFTVADSGEAAFIASTPERPVDLYLASGKSEKRLTDFNGGLLSQLHVAPTETLRYTAPDGRPIEGWYLKPIGLKKGQKAPMVVSMHGGPHVMWGPAMASMWLEWQLQAASGYTVFYCNPRGSDGYGDEFSTVITGDWGDDVMRDILTGVDRMVEMGFVDVKRMALTGGSYAGYMTAWIVGHDHRFACAWTQRGLYSVISMYGVTDIPLFMEREFGMATPFDDLEKSWAQSPLAYVKNIRTPLAIEHQDNDFRCPVSEAEQLYAALKRLKREVVFYRYPRDGHEMSRSGEPHHRVDRLKRMVEWFDRYCRKKRTTD